MFVIDENDILYHINENTILVDLNKKTKKVITDQDEVANLYNSAYSPIVNSPVIPDVNPQLDINLTDIINLYPSGSYFTANGSACDNHNHCSYTGGCNCKYYSGAIQCVGFAKFASDKYAHKSSWHAVSGDIIETNVCFDTVTRIKAYFSSLSTGAYVWLSHYNNESGFHALFFIKNDSTNVKTYECNVGSNCIVKIFNYSYEYYKNTRFKSNYTNVYGIYRVTHRFSSNAVSMNSTYHKYTCMSSGCDGYIKEYHYTNSPGLNATCSGCGWVGNIEHTSPIVRGTY